MESARSGRARTRMRAVFPVRTRCVGEMKKLLIEKTGSAENAREFAYRTLKKNILNFVLVPGDRMSEAAAADALGCRTVRGFALLRPASGALCPEALAEALASAGPILRAAGMRLLLEADPGVNTSNHAALAAVLYAGGNM